MRERAVHAYRRIPVVTFRVNEVNKKAPLENNHIHFCRQDHL